MAPTATSSVTNQIAYICLFPLITVISKRISCSISGLCNQRNETQSESRCVTSGQRAPHNSHRHFAVSPPIPLTVAVYGARSRLRNRLLRYGDFLFRKGTGQEALLAGRITSLPFPYPQRVCGPGLNLV